MNMNISGNVTWSCLTHVCCQFWLNPCFFWFWLYLILPCELASIPIYCWYKCTETSPCWQLDDQLWLRLLHKPSWLQLLVVHHDQLPWLRYTKILLPICSCAFSIQHTTIYNIPQRYLSFTDLILASKPIQNAQNAIPQRTRRWGHWGVWAGTSGGRICGRCQASHGNPTCSHGPLWVIES